MEDSANMRFMQMAIDLAIENVRSGNGGPFGAVIVKNDVVIATGVNAVALKNDPTAHAEIEAIRVACEKLGTFQLAGCDVYASCEPCPMCHGALYWARPKRIFYASSKQEAAKIGFDDNYIYEELFVPVTERKIKTEVIRPPSSGDPFALWVKLDRKVLY